MSEKITIKQKLTNFYCHILEWIMDVLYYLYSRTYTKPLICDECDCPIKHFWQYTEYYEIPMHKKCIQKREDQDD